MAKKHVRNQAATDGGTQGGTRDDSWDPVMGQLRPVTKGRHLHRAPKQPFKVPSPVIGVALASAIVVGIPVAVTTINPSTYHLPDSSDIPRPTFIQKPAPSAEPSGESEDGEARDNAPGTGSKPAPSKPAPSKPAPVQPAVPGSGDAQQGRGGDSGADAADQDAADQEAVDQEAVDQEAVDQEAVDQEAVDQGAVDQEAVDQEAVDQGDTGPDGNQPTPEKPAPSDPIPVDPIPADPPPVAHPAPAPRVPTARTPRHAAVHQRVVHQRAIIAVPSLNRAMVVHVNAPRGRGSVTIVVRASSRLRSANAGSHGHVVKACASHGKHHKQERQHQAPRSLVVTALGSGR